MDLSQKLPDYITDRKNLARLVIFTATFALVFLNIYAPFGIKTFLRIKQDWDLFLMAIYITLTGVLVVVISRIIMYWVSQKGRKLSILAYLIWIAIEILSMAMFYTLYEIFFFEDPRPASTAFGKSLLNTSLVLLIPYSVSWLYFSWRDKIRLLAVMGDPNDYVSHKVMIPFRDEKGTLRISIKPDDFLYLQGSDNYVTVYYHLHNKAVKFLLRSTMKKMEEELHGLEIKRCHRSYMININKVKLVKKEKEGLILVLDTNPAIEIPVSKTYLTDVLQAFGHIE